MAPRAEAVWSGCLDNTIFTLELPTDAWKNVKVEEKNEKQGTDF
jgi:hypothetical protein